MPTAKELRAHADLLELEEKLAAAKKQGGRGSKKSDATYRKLKEQVRDKRLEYRAERDGLTVTTVNGRKVAK